MADLPKVTALKGNRIRMDFGDGFGLEFPDDTTRLEDLCGPDFLHYERVKGLMDYLKLKGVPLAKLADSKEVALKAEVDGLQFTTSKVEARKI
jgi:hypothetical protein